MTQPTKRALVIGGSGLVGVPVCQQLKSHGVEVFCLTRNADRAPPGVTPVIADLADRKWVSDCRDRIPQIDALIYLAYSISDDLEYDRRVNCGGLVDALGAYEPRQVVFTGTVGIFGSYPPDGDYDEDSPRCADSEYARSKLHAIDVLKERGSGTITTILHPSIVYGDASARVVYYRDLLRSGYFIYERNGSGLYNVVHADDVATAVLLSLDRNCGECVEEYIVSAEAAEFRTWIDILERRFGYSDLPKLPKFLSIGIRGGLRRAVGRLGLRAPMRLTGPKVRLAESKVRFNSEKIARSLGWQPQRRLAEMAEASDRDAAGMR